MTITPNTSGARKRGTLAPCSMTLLLLRIRNANAPAQSDARAPSRLTFRPTNMCRALARPEVAASGGRASRRLLPLTSRRALFFPGAPNWRLGGRVEARRELLWGDSQEASYAHRR